MILDILDTIIAHAYDDGWMIKYIAISQADAKVLVDELNKFTDNKFSADSIALYKEVPIKVKDIVGFQVAYELPF